MYNRTGRADVPLKSSRKSRAAEPSTKERILGAAEMLFAARTFAGTQVDAIAEAAAVNKRLIYHYFGDKAGLYREVLRRVHRRWTTFDYFKEAPKDPLEFIDGFVCWSFEKYRTDPNFVKLIVGENILEGQYFEIASPSPFTFMLLTTFSEVVQRGKIQGGIRPDVDPIQLLGTIIALCFFTFSNAYTMSRTLQVDLRDPAVLKGRLTHIRDVVRRAIAATT
jgi:TetR/AcrR family transcriptional regulator